MRLTRGNIKESDLVDIGSISSVTRTPHTRNNGLGSIDEEIKTMSSESLSDLLLKAITN